jgi:hypothetical protein
MHHDNIQLLTLSIGTSRFYEINGMDKPAGYEKEQ